MLFSEGGKIVIMEGIVGLVCCILCAFPLFVMGHYNNNSREPITFWAGDKSLKEKVKDIQGYNKEISKLYLMCALVFAATGILCLIYFWLGMICVLLESTLGIYVVWKIYKNILLRNL